MRIEFQHAFAHRVGLTDYDLVAEVDLVERVAEITIATITATGRTAKLTRERRAKAERLALALADERFPS